jgi:hypothetical protein
MSDESAVWNEEGDKNLKERGVFPHQEAYSEIECIQNDMLNLISELNNLKEKFLNQELSDEKSQKVLEFIEKTLQEINELKK